MSQAAQNKDVVRGFFDCVIAGDLDNAWAKMAPEMTWTFPGHNPVAGTYTREELIDQVISKISAAVPGKQDYIFKAFTAEDDRVVVEFETVGTAVDGRAFNNHYHLVYIVRDGLIRSCREYFDTYHFCDILLNSKPAA